MEQLIELLNRINFDTPGLEKAGELFVKKDYDACIDEIISHFRRRTSPEYIFSAELAIFPWVSRAQGSQTFPNLQVLSKTCLPKPPLMKLKLKQYVSRF